MSMAYYSASREWLNEWENERKGEWLTGRELNDWMQAWISDGTDDRATE